MENATLEKCQRLIEYRFSDPSILAKALTHSSVAPLRVESNERLEFLGDAVLGLVICHDLYTRYDELLEGDLTKIKSSVVSRQTCAVVADTLGISGLLFLGKGMDRMGDLPSSIAAGVLESIIGAIYVDGGLEPARRFILDHLRPHIDKVMADEYQGNYKSILQQYAQYHWSRAPEYQFLDEKGPDHSKCFEVAVTINGRHFPSAWGKSKKEAEQEAARRALAELGLLAADP